MADTPQADSGHVSTEELMAGIRRRIGERGGLGEDGELVAEAAETLRDALGRRSQPRLLLPEMLGPESEWRIETYLRITSHRGLAGRPIVFFKRRVLMPLTRWLFEYVQENFRRQRRVNEALFAAVEELAVDNARLRRRLAAAGQPAAGEADGEEPPGGPPTGG